MHASIYVCMHVYTCVCIYMYIRVCVYVCVYICAEIYHACTRTTTAELASEGERLNRDRERERSDFGSRASALMYMFMAGNLAVYIYI